MLNVSLYIYKIQWMIIGTQVIPLYKSIFSLWSYIRTWECAFQVAIFTNGIWTFSGHCAYSELSFPSSFLADLCDIAQGKWNIFVSSPYPSSLEEELSMLRHLSHIQQISCLIFIMQNILTNGWLNEMHFNC